MWQRSNGISAVMGLPEGIGMSRFQEVGGYGPFTDGQVINRPLLLNTFMAKAYLTPPMLRLLSFKAQRHNYF